MHKKMNPALEVVMLKKEIARLNGVIEQMKYESRLLKGFTIQQCQDMFEIGLGREFGFGPDRNERAERAFRQAFVDYAGLCVEDGKSDEEIWYTKETLDRALSEVRGDILPFDERYAEKNLYFRDNMQEWKNKEENK